MNSSAAPTRKVRALGAQAGFERMRRIVCLSLLAALLVCPLSAGAQSADDIARAIVIGQAYTSGNVYVGGFSRPDAEGPRAGEWPKRVAVIAFRTPNVLPLKADFTRALAPDSEELYYFPQREDGGSAGPDDLFSTIDSMMVIDPNLALYTASTRPARPVAVFGWDDRLSVVDVSVRHANQPRPLTGAERQEIPAQQHRAMPKDAECTTEPQFLDSARVLLTARVGKAGPAIRLSTYADPGCMGHLSEVYVLDVIEPGRAPRRFEFRHYAGLL